MKARFSASFDRDTIGRAIFTPPDGGAQIEVIAILVRIDPDGQAFTFVRLDPSRRRTPPRSDPPRHRVAAGRSS